MLHEPASSFDDDNLQKSRQLPLTEPEADPQEPHYSEIRAMVETVLAIDSETFHLDGKQPDLFMIPADSKLLVTYSGRLKVDSELAYHQLDLVCRPHDLLPIFRLKDGAHQVHLAQGRVIPNSGGDVLSVILFILTIISVLYVGTLMALSEIFARNEALGEQLLADLPAQLWRGWPYALSILLILGAHELGHYFMARWHQTAASLPYFLPFPFGIFGTFGAAIRLREPMRNRKVLLDIGAAGPLTGMIFAIPILIAGLVTSPVVTIQPGGMVEGNSILYALAKILVFGRFLPDGVQDVYVNQLAWAGWTGFLVTGLNLLPVGQLDGGHVTYALLGRRARLLYYPVALGLVALALLAANELIVFAVLVLLLGNLHAVPLDDITPLDKRRQRLAIFTLVLFALVFVPVPLSPSVGGVQQVPLPGGEWIYLPITLATLWLARRRR